jgi:trehalose 6-phosphate phosphatase
MIVQTPDLAYPRHISGEVDLLSRALGAADRVYLFLDYGGTLVSGASDAGARPSPDVLEKLEQLSQVDSFSVFVLSRRTVAELEELLGIQGIGLVGQRGFEIRRANGPTVHSMDPGLARDLIRHLELDVHACLASYAGLTIENRGFALAMRLACKDAKVAQRATQRFTSLVRSIDALGQLEIFYGEDLVEARMGGWHKGDAVSQLLREADARDSLAIYVGDDVTDEDGFEAVTLWSESTVPNLPWFMADPDDEDAPSALTILVSPEPRPTKASMFVRGPHEVYEFLSSLAAIAANIL